MCIPTYVGPRHAPKVHVQGFIETQFPRSIHTSDFSFNPSHHNLVPPQTQLSLVQHSLVPLEILVSTFQCLFVGLRNVFQPRVLFFFFAQLSIRHATLHFPDLDLFLQTFVYPEVVGLELHPGVIAVLLGRVKVEMDHATKPVSLSLLVDLPLITPETVLVYRPLFMLEAAELPPVLALLLKCKVHGRWVREPV
ncbi:hypothetical protein BDV95DRAFT_588507 [Massariosphaeria phaeospora]|uniref:Uncharacterized protein n=1 Tax=Massariosphaeria phaeospora TaxID=100035 RepID=A0A7C8HY69_9PLEO|nr:hypothetical protein BDV95DRAFT_588507 [Massariosphaeria phaeospora]